MPAMSTPYTHTLTHTPGSTVEIKVSLDWNHVAPFQEVAFKKLAEHLTLDGFRKGQIPPEIARKHIPEELVLGEAAELAVNDIYPRLITEAGIDPIGKPVVAITKLVKDNPLEYTITTAVVPAITLPDYKAIAKGVALDTPKEITEEDVDKVIHDLRQIRAYGHIHADHDDHQHTEELPEVNDEFAKSFGDFATVADLRAKIHENLTTEAAQAVHDKRRVAIIEAILGKTTFDVPQIVLDAEADKMLAQIESEVARSGATLADYLTHINKTKEGLLKEFAPEAEKRARFQLLLNAIARAEQTLPTEAEVEAEAQKLIAMYPTADPARTKAYADMMLTNEKVLSMLESLS